MCIRDRRMEVSKEMAAYKKANGLPTLDMGRERALLGKVGEQAGDCLLYTSRCV